MGFAKGSKYDAVKALINMWLKDRDIYCGQCGEQFYVGRPKCCDEPFLGNNSQMLKQFLSENKRIKSTRANKFASNKDNSMRLGLSIPADLYAYLQDVFGSCRPIGRPEVFHPLLQQHQLKWKLGLCH